MEDIDVGLVLKPGTGRAAALLNLVAEQCGHLGRPIWVSVSDVVVFMRIIGQVEELHKGCAA